MTDLDKRIFEALKEEDREVLKSYSEEAGLFELVGASFKGKQRFFSIGIWILNPIILGAAIYCGLQFFSADSTQYQMAWMAGFLLSFISIGQLKVWYWMELNKITMLREIKRLELQVALLASKDHEH